MVPPPPPTYGPENCIFSRQIYLVNTLNFTYAFPMCVFFLYKYMKQNKYYVKQLI